MKAVGIKELKARLSEYLRQVRAGETILVTDREEVVAELGPVRRKASRPDSLEATLEALAEAGELTRASLSRSGWRWQPRPLGLPPGTVSALLDELRGEREGHG